MLDHHIQRTIVYKLALATTLRFSELKPDELENKLFTYHLKKVVSEGYAAKDQEGLYKLTPEGRRLGVYILDNTEPLFDRADPVIFMAVRRKEDHSWLLYRRKSHPLIGKVGFMHTTPNASELSTETAAKSLLEKTGLVGTFEVLGAGFFRIYEESRLESFTNFTLLVCNDAVGSLQADDELADYFWVSSPDSESANLLPNMPTLLELYEEGRLFFVERTLKIT